MNINQTQRTRPWPGFPTSRSLGSFGDANCMEQLLVHCANAIESNNATLSQQILWVLNNIAPPDGDSNQRLTFAFLRALIARASKSGTCKLLAAMANAHYNLALHTHKFSVIELASFVDVTPWHRFGFTAANAAILEAVEGYLVIHIVDLSLTHCMQIPTLIDAIANRFEVAPLIKLTVAGATEDGCLIFHGFSSLIEQLRVQHLVYAESGEALVINCHMMLHYIPEETLSDFPSSKSNPYSYESSCSSMSSFRTTFLKSLRSLDPTIVVLVDEDADLTSNNLESRLRSAFNYLWIPFDTVDTFLPRGSNQRQWYEADKMRFLKLRPCLIEHAAGWGLKKEDDDLVLTWKGHNVVFASAWLPV
ncbi:hypothetical protein POTOM_021414 [Populus tomentosa]|uniref:Scarecrow-like protein 32 n=1 Tax=Populus tomentosa TaxID=118781 RepID=A0A8X8D188_POPTO|nr:hypothetical protein POTOM_021414 [Populus tomentosa]